MKPTVAQLLILADSTEKRRLTDAEVGALRTGLHHLAEQQRKAAATVGGLQNKVREWRNKAEQAQVELAQTQPYRVPCPHCGADAGQRCQPVAGGEPPATPHVARLHTATRKDQP